MRERNIEEAWVESAVRRPSRREPDAADNALEHRLRRIEAFGNRVLRVVVTWDEPPHVVTAFFDRSFRGDPSL
jgi:hypothetical protein